MNDLLGQRQATARHATLLWALGVSLLLAATTTHTLLMQALADPTGSRPKYASPWPPHELGLWLLQAAFGICAMLAWAVAWLHKPRRPPLDSAIAQRRALALAGGLAVADLALAALYWTTRDHTFAQQGSVLRGLFAMGAEFRLPALFATAQLWLLAGLAVRCWQRYRQTVWLWAALICAYLGLDELLSLHEQVGHAVRYSSWMSAGEENTVEVAGLHVYPWVLVFGPIALMLGLALVGGMARVLRPGEIALLVLAGTVFLVGAIGFEIVQSHGVATLQHARASSQTVGNVMVEETLEKLGVTLAVFVFARRSWGAD